MKGNEIKLKEIEDSHTLGGSGKGRFQGIRKWSEMGMFYPLSHTPQTIHNVTFIVSSSVHSGNRR